MQILKSAPEIPWLPAVGRFSLNDNEAYQRWRDEKLSDYPANTTDLLVEIEDPFELTAAEKAAIIERCRKTNMVVYQFKHPSGDPADKAQVKKLGEQLGLQRFDSNLCADNDSITSLKVVAAGRHHTYIPYSNHKISWHTDGYYNTLTQQIHSVLLHCVSPAARGGANALLDPEIAYIHLRDSNPDYIYALMDPQVMSIPANEEQGELIRAAQTGPVFSVARSGTGDDHLHMRYTARTRSIEWKDEERVQSARECLTTFLNSDSSYIFRHKLESGQGLICNNVLHDRSAFEDEGEPRLLYRARYFDRIRGT